MKINVKFAELDCLLKSVFNTDREQFKAAFGEVHEVRRDDIPSDYGKITYTQEKIIIVS